MYFPFPTQLAGKVINLIQSSIKTTYEKAKECLDTNYYGVKNVTEALIPLLQLSTSGARIVNVSSLRSELRVSKQKCTIHFPSHNFHQSFTQFNLLIFHRAMQRIPNEQTRKLLGDIENLTEEKIDETLQKFLHNLKEDTLEANGWQQMLPAYSISKATLNAYTRLLAKKHPNMCINCVHPGYVNTDLNWHTGPLTTEEGAQGPVMLALLPHGGPSGHYFDQTVMAEF